MSKKFDYLKKYTRSNYPKGEILCVHNHNIFYNLKIDDILESEKKLGFQFPDQLRSFYQEIGCGYLTTPLTVPENHHFPGVNEILFPLVTATFYKPLEDNGWTEDDGPIDGGDEDHYMSAMSYDFLEPGDLPFFEIGDSSAFLVMRPHSENPNAVWSDTGIKIEDSFEKFIWRLYYEDPGYYGEVIKAHYENKERDAND